MKAMAVIGLLSAATVQAVLVDFEGVPNETPLADLSFQGVVITSTAAVVYNPGGSGPNAYSYWPVNVHDGHVEGIYPFSQTPPEIVPNDNPRYQTTISLVFDTPTASVGWEVATEKAGFYVYTLTDGNVSEEHFGGAVGMNGLENSHTFMAHTLTAPPGWLIESITMTNTSQSAFAAAMRLDNVEFPLSVAAVPDSGGPAIAGLALCALGLVAMRQKGGKPA